MIWQRKKGFLLVGWLLVMSLCFIRSGWSQKISANQLKSKLREAEESYSAKDYSKAEEIFIDLSDSFPRDSRFSYFQLMIAKCEYHQKKYDSAQEKFKEFIHQFPYSRFLPVCHFMLGNIDYLQGRTFESAQNFTQTYQLAKAEQLKDLTLRSLEPLFKKWLSEKELETLSQREKTKKLAPKIFFWLGKRNMERGNYAQAIEALNYYRDNFPRGEDIKEVKRLLKEASPSSSQIIKVGVLVSSRGDLSTYGKNFSDGIRLALSSYHSTKRTVELVLKDTEDDSVETNQLTRELIDEDNVVYVAAALSSESLAGAAVMAERWGVPLITPAAAKQKTVSSKDFVFQLSPSPARKGKSMAEFLVGNQRFSDFAMLLPEESQKQDEVLNFKETVESLGGKVVAVGHYPAGTDDFLPYIKRIKSMLLGIDPASLQDESGSFFDQMPAKVDGFFISADEKDMYSILSNLANLKIYTTIIGMAGWKDRQLISLAQSLKQELIFTSEEYSSDEKSELGPSVPEKEDFAMLYSDQYKKEPDRVFTLGYDSMKLLLSILDNVTTPEEIREALSRISDFKGASGEIRFDENGENSYIPIYKLENGQVTRLW